MADPRPIPTVLHPVDLLDFLLRLLDNHQPGSQLIVCHSEIDFLRHILASVSLYGSSSAHEDGDEPANADHAADRLPEHILLSRTLHMLRSAKNVQVVFCPSLQSLHAYLATHGSTDTMPITSPFANSRSARILGLLNPLQIHAGTPSFSAQGLSRTFASAVEAACRTSQHLVIAECITPDVHHAAQDQGVDEATLLQDSGLDPPHVIDPWDQEMSILNTTTRTFAPGERGWVGRTVKAREVAERWCHFKRLS